MSSSDAGKYKHYIDRFTFRNKGAITIPKNAGAGLARETCYKLSVDIVIESITKPEYRNFRTIPYHGFYGYATLVKRDCLDEKIQLQFGRNRIFEQRIVEAFQGWNELAFYLRTTKPFLELLARSLSVGDVPSNLTNICDIEAFLIYWNETDLREVYVKCTENTQFYIEIAWTEPEKFTDNCGEEQDGKSKQPDNEDKDKGLPKSGTQPKKNDPNDPWAGNKPANGVPSDSPYYNDGIDNLDNPNPSNNADNPDDYPEDYGYFIRGEAYGRGNPNNPCGVVKYIYYVLVSSDTTSASFEVTSTELDPCGDVISKGRIITNTGRVLDGNASALSASFTLVRSPSLPMGSTTYL